MARIPISADVAELIGHAAEKVENRSLLLDKFVFHKSWPEAIGDRGAIKWDEASRWSFLRIAEGAASLLHRDAEEKRRRASGQNVEPANRDRLLGEARVAEALSSVAWDHSDLAALRARHTRRFLHLFHHGQGERSRALVARLEGRLAINLADSLIQNAGIALDRLFGLPYIPGSAVKGVCRAAALEEMNAANGPDRERIFGVFRRVFGTADNDYRPDHDLTEFRALLGDQPENQRGAVAFLPAYPVNEAKVVVDLTNVHFPEYYRTGNIGDLSNESPRPNPFPCVKEGAQFAFCLVLSGTDHDPTLLVEAERWLVQALTVRGIGAKTAAGYGWFSIEPPSVLEGLFAEERRAQEAAAKAAQQAAEVKAAAEREAARKASLKPEARFKEEFCRLPDQDFATKVLAIASLPADEQRGLLLALLDPGKRDRWKKWKKGDKETDKKRVAAVLEVSKNHGIALP